MLLAVRALGQLVAQRIRDSRRIERLAVQRNHLLLGPADEMLLPSLRRIGVKRLLGRQDVRLQQPPQAIIWIVLAHVGRGGQQEQVLRAPVQLPARAESLDARQSLGQPVAVGLADVESGSRSAASLWHSSKTTRS